MDNMTQNLSIPALREEMGLSLEKFAEALGLQSKSRASEIERGAPVSLPVALKLESLSGGRIDAAALCPAVAEARAGCECFHTAPDTAAASGASAGKSGDVTGSAVEEHGFPSGRTEGTEGAGVAHHLPAPEGLA
jgi:DNA-binding XRE family transcriptional regulator